MAIKKFLPLLAENPLCGISEYKDVLDLSTGGVTRRVKKYVFTGEENGTIYSTGTSRKGIEITGIPGIIGGDSGIAILAICTHYQPGTRDYLWKNTDNGISNSYKNNNIIFFDESCQTVDAFQQFCTQQYQNGTPVTVWYVLSTPETETITVPSGLTGTIEGYLTQSGTPTPSAPIYPEANPALVWAPTTYRKYGTEIETITSLPAQIIGDGQSIMSCQISGNTVQDGTPTPEAPVDVVGCGTWDETHQNYKLPLTVNGTEYPIYLGEAQTTRRIKKLVLTGEENWILWTSGQTDVERYYYKWGKTTPSDMLICTHFPYIGGDGNFEHVRLGGSHRDDFVIFISKTIASTVVDFKSYLSAQYQNGTPVTVWYVLAEPETGIVNEPLMKIGDYADTVSAANIPTTGIPETFDVGTTLKPSEVALTYHGWHEYTDTKYTQ